MAQSLRQYTYKAPEGRISHLIVGAGVVGLSIARQLCRLTDKTTFLVERHPAAGQETSSRNSEVIHAGLYYPLESNKTRLCIRGRTLLYDYAAKRGVSHRKATKLVVAASPEQHDYLRLLHDHASSIPKALGAVPTQLLSGDEARELEPDLSQNITSALLSLETGIVSSHEFMDSLESDIQEAETGDVAYGTKVVRIDPADKSGWVVQTQTGDDEPQAVQVDVVVNAAGLNAHTILNHILPQEAHRKQYFCKGSYFAYKGPGVSSVKRLLYPCPEKNVAGLGTHLTLDLTGGIRFGPDVEWLNQPPDGNPDFWQDLLAPSSQRHRDVFEAVQRYLPGVDYDGLHVDYAGIRPKLSGPGEPPEDFRIEHVAPGFINLSGIESPGLTSSLAIAEDVLKMVKRDVWGLGRGNGKTVSEVGNISDWA